MRAKIIIVFAAMIAMTTGVRAHAHHHYAHHAASLKHYHYYHDRTRRLANASHRVVLPVGYSSGGIVTVQTAANIPITVASTAAAKFQQLIAKLVEAGYRPRSIGGLARGGHVRNSLHYSGNAIDLDQTGWGRTAGFMRTRAAHAIIVSLGLRDGCEFHDCGHVDTGRSLGKFAYANRRHGVRRYSDNRYMEHRVRMAHR